MFPIKIETDRVLIRELSESDWVQIQEYASDEEVVRYETWGPNSENQTKEFLSYAIKASRESPRQAFELAVILRDTNGPTPIWWTRKVMLSWCNKVG